MGRVEGGQHTKNTGYKERTITVTWEPQVDKTLPPFFTNILQGVQDDPIGDEQKHEDDHTDRPIIGNHCEANNVGVSAGQI